MKDKPKISEIINKHLKKSPFKDEIKVSENDIDFHNNRKYIHWQVALKGSQLDYEVVDNNKFAELLNRKLKIDRKQDKGTFYHFSCYNIAQKMLTKKEIQLSSLTSQFSNDSAELIEFIHRYLNATYPNPQSLLDISSNIFVFCFTRHFRNEKFWSDYANEDTGICLGFRLKDINLELAHLFDFVDIFYDDGYSFDFINDIQRELDFYYEKKLFIGGLNRFARNYKRQRYAWESETRLIFDIDENKRLLDFYEQMRCCEPKHDLMRYFKIIKDDDREYIQLNFINEFFTLELDEVIFGKKVSQSQIDEIEAFVNEDVHCWQR